MGVIHSGTDLLHQWKEDQCGNGVRDESGHDKNQEGESEQDPVETEVLHLGGYTLRDCAQETGGCDGLAETEASGRQDDDSPEEVVEVLFGEDASAKEQDHGNDGDDAHVSKSVLELVANAP